MKILFLSRRFYPDIGGVEKHVLEIGKIMVKEGHKVTVITQSPGKEIEYQNIKIIRIPKTPKGASEKLHVWKWFWKNRQLIKDADIVHAHDVYWWYWPYKFIFLSKKSFITFHGYESYPIKKSSIIIRRISAFLATGNIEVGEFIRKWYGTKADFVIYGGVEESNFNYQISNKQESINKNDESAIFIGRLDEDTGILEYLEAERKIKKHFNNFNLKIIGDGKYKHKIKSKNHIGFITNYHKYLHSANYVFSSSYLMILEALSHKKLVFSVYSNDLKKDYLLNTPFKDYIIICKNVNELIDNFFYFQKNPNKEKVKTERGYKWAKNQTWENLVNKYYKLWEKK